MYSLDMEAKSHLSQQSSFQRRDQKFQLFPHTLCKLLFRAFINLSGSDILHVQADQRIVAIFRDHCTAMQLLSRIDQRGKARIISAVMKICRSVVSFLIDIDRLPCLHRFCNKFQASCSCVRRLVRVVNTGFPTVLPGLFFLIPDPDTYRMCGARKLKMTTVDPLFRNLFPRLRHRFLRQCISQSGDVECSIGNIHKIHGSHNAGAGQEIIDRSAPFIIVNPLQTVSDAYDRSHITYVTVCIPSAHITNTQSIRKVTFPVKQRQDHNRNIRNDMTVTRIFIIAIMLMNIMETVPPVLRMHFMVCHHGTHHLCIFTVRRNIGQPFFHDPAPILLHKSTADAHCHENTAVNAVSIMGHTGRFSRKPGCQVRIARRHKPPGINKDLASDLFCDSTAVLSDTAALRRSHAVLQIQISRMLRRYPITAPPKETMFKRRIVEQRLRHILGFQVKSVSAVFQRPQEKQRTVAVIIRSKLFVVYGIMI